MSFLVLSATAAAAQSLVYRVDSATAVISGRHLIVTAKGAARSGGWQNARLVVRKPSAPEAHDLEIAFVATPPVRDSVVAQSLMPMSVTLTTGLPHYGIAAVKVLSATNAVTVGIVPKRDARQAANR
jgi:hypothetical protein